MEHKVSSEISMIKFVEDLKESFKGNEDKALSYLCLAFHVNQMANFAVKMNELYSQNPLSDEMSVEKMSRDELIHDLNALGSYVATQQQVLKGFFLFDKKHIDNIAKVNESLMDMFEFGGKFLFIQNKDLN